MADIFKRIFFIADQYISIQLFTVVYFIGSNSQKVSISSGNDLTTQQAWTNVDRVLWRHKSSLYHSDMMEANDTKGIFVTYLPGSDELILWYQKQVPQAGISNIMNPGYFPLRPLSWNRNKYPCFYIFPLEIGGVGDLHTHQNRRVLC